MANNFFLIRFSEEEDYQRAAFGGPWKIYDYYISVARWSPSFNDEEPLKTIMTWVRLPKLPIQYFNHVAVNRIGNYIGRTIRMDLATSEGARARYARVCVEIDLSKPLLGKFSIEDREFHIVYESLENMCFTCGFYGHKDAGCLSNKPVLSPERENPAPEAAEDSAERDIGNWMTVCRRKKNRSPSQIVPTEKKISLSSRFEILSRNKERSESPGKATPLKARETDATAESSSTPTKSDGQIEALKRILDAAIASGNSSSKEAAQTPKTQLGEPLKDISNAELGSKAKKGAGKAPAKGKEAGKAPTKGKTAEAELFSVPVTYHNPTFQADSSDLTKLQPPTTYRLKANSTKNRLVKMGGKEPVRTKKEATKPVRKFVSQNQKVVVPTTESSDPKAGEPPDPARQ
ncbi:hypothetical protein LINPERHAP2_LOCUS5370 [Linum perenne]